MNAIRSWTRALIAMLTLAVSTAPSFAEDSLSGVWLTSSSDVLLLTQSEIATGGILIGPNMGFAGVDGKVEDDSFSFRAPGVAIEGERDGAWIQGSFTRSANKNSGAVEFDFSAFRPVALSTSLLDGVWCLEDDSTGQQSYFVAFTTTLYGFERTRIIEVFVDEQGRAVGSEVYLGRVFGPSGLFLAFSSNGAIGGQVSDGLVQGAKTSWVGEETSFFGSRK